MYVNMIHYTLIVCFQFIFETHPALSPFLTSIFTVYSIEMIDQLIMIAIMTIERGTDTSKLIAYSRVSWSICY